MLHILTIWWRNVVLGIMNQFDSKIDLVIYVGQWPIFYGPLILRYDIVIDLLFLYIKNGAGQEYSCPPGYLLWIFFLLTYVCYAVFVSLWPLYHSDGDIFFVLLWQRLIL